MAYRETLADKPLDGEGFPEVLDDFGEDGLSAYYIVGHMEGAAEEEEI